MFEFINSALDVAIVIVVIVALILIFPKLKQAIRIVRQGGKAIKQTNNTRKQHMAKNNETIEQMNKDLAALKQTFKCPSCGAALTITSDTIGSFCTFCGSPIPNSQDLIKLSLEYKNKLADRDLQLQKMQHEEKQDKRLMTKQMVFGIAILLFYFLIFGSMFYLIFRRH